MNGRATRVLMVNLHSTANAGDAALLEMGVKVLKDALPGAIVTLAMNEPDAKYSSDPTTPVIPSFNYLCAPSSASGIRWTGVVRIALGALTVLAGSLLYRLTGRVFAAGIFRQLLRSYAAADVVVSCPGNIFAATGKRGLPFLVSAVTTGMPVVMGKPLYILPQSIGPLTRAWQRRLVRIIFGRARAVMVREPVSLRLAELIGLPRERLHLIPDLAFAYEPTGPVDQSSAVARPGTGPLVGVTAVNRLLSAVGDDVWVTYEQGLAAALAAFIDKHEARVVFLPQVTGPTAREDDRIAARRIAASVDRPAYVTVMEERLSPGALKVEYSRLDLLVGTRMHSAIFAASSGTPVLLVEYLSKSRGLAEMLGIEAWCVELADARGPLLSSRLEELWARREDVRRQLIERTRVFRAEANRASEIIRRDWGDGRSERPRGDD